MRLHASAALASLTCCGATSMALSLEKNGLEPKYLPIRISALQLLSLEYVKFSFTRQMFIRSPRHFSFDIVYTIMLIPRSVSLQQVLHKVYRVLLLR